METMIPPQVGMRLWRKKEKGQKEKKKGPKKRKEKKGERKREKGQCYYPFFHTCASK